MSPDLNSLLFPFYAFSSLLLSLNLCLSETASVPAYMLYNLSLSYMCLSQELTLSFWSSKEKNVWEKIKPFTKVLRRVLQGFKSLAPIYPNWFGKQTSLFIKRCLQMVGFNLYDIILELVFNFCAWCFQQVILVH